MFHITDNVTGGTTRLQRKTLTVIQQFGPKKNKHLKNNMHLLYEEIKH